MALGTTILFHGGAQPRSSINYSDISGYPVVIKNGQNYGMSQRGRAHKVRVFGILHDTWEQRDEMTRQRV